MANRQQRRAKKAFNKNRIRKAIGRGQIGWDHVRTFCNEAAIEKGEWAGAPMIAEGVPLVLEKRYPFQGLAGMYNGEHYRTGRQYHHAKNDPEDDQKPADGRLVNKWYCRRRDMDVHVWRLKSGKTLCTTQPRCIDRYEILFRTLTTYMTLRHEAEEVAARLLQTMITEAQWKCYVLTGMFLESSPRSGGVYIFRKGRPTIAMRLNSVRNLYPACAMCMHPIGFYEGTWMGVMAPSDEVIAHLLTMRADEPGLWRKANQHPIWNVEAGI